MEDLEQRLQAARRHDEKKAYGDLIRTLENNLTRVDDSNRLQYVHDETNNSIANDSARRKIEQFVDVAKFVRFADSRNIIVNEQLWSVANLFTDTEQLTRPAMSTTSPMPATKPVPKPTTSEPPTSTLENENESKDGQLDSKQVGTLARILVALAIHHHGYQPVQPLTTEHGTRVKGGTYAPIYKICEKLGFERPSEWETVKKLLLKACNKIGMDEVMSAVGRHQELTRDEPQVE